jgi:hypothetical protein
MKLRNKQKLFWLILLFCIIFVYIFYYTIEIYENVEVSVKMRNFNKDGFCVLFNPLYSLKTNDLHKTPCIELHNDVLNLLPDNYMFIDYTYKINNTSLSTFHRDVTSSQHIYATRHPVYTLILYLYDGELLSLCPKSHKSYPFVWEQIVNVNGKSGSAFLFDCDVLHAGRMNQCRERKII